MGDFIDGYMDDIIMFASLNDSWYDCNGIEPSKEVTDNFKNFITKIITKYNHSIFKYMRVFSTSDGGIQLEFDYGDNFFEIEFLPSGSLSIRSELHKNYLENDNVDYEYAIKMLDSFITKVSCV